jgi:RloB-like protein
MAKRGVRPHERTRGYHARQVETQEPLERFLIVCEGVKSEPNYFRSFRVTSASIKVVGLGLNTRGLVEKALELGQDEDYNQIWCVFDRDSFPTAHFNAALELAAHHQIKVAYSNEAFELWYLLHFHYYNTAMVRSEYIGKLSELLGMPYKKNLENIYDQLRLRQEVALKNAKRLLGQYRPLNPAIANPSTTVHQLVEQLNRFVRR